MVTTPSVGWEQLLTLQVGSRCGTSSADEAAGPRWQEEAAGITSAPADPEVGGGARAAHRLSSPSFELHPLPLRKGA
jgi:hypothetical protein